MQARSVVAVEGEVISSRRATGARSEVLPALRVGRRDNADHIWQSRRALDERTITIEIEPIVARRRDQQRSVPRHLVRRTCEEHPACGRGVALFAYPHPVSGPGVPERVNDDVRAEAVGLEDAVEDPGERAPRCLMTPRTARRARDPVPADPVGVMDSGQAP
jgi:hypothetical protein